MLLAIYGIFVVLSGNLLIDFKAMWSHIKSNPISYFLALWAANLLGRLLEFHKSLGERTKSDYADFCVGYNFL